MVYTATIEPRNKGAQVVLLAVDNNPVGCVWFNKPYRGISCGQLRWIDNNFNRHEEIVFALATPQSVASQAEYIIKKYIQLVLNRKEKGKWNSETALVN